jgi:hypothetical protein
MKPTPFTFKQTAESDLSKESDLTKITVTMAVCSGQN